MSKFKASMAQKISAKDDDRMERWINMLANTDANFPHTDGTGEQNTKVLTPEQIENIRANMREDKELLTRKYKQYAVRLLSQNDEISKQEALDKAPGLFVLDSSLAGLLVASMQYVIALATEIVNLIVISGQKSVIDCIMNFVALKVISEVDDIYLGSIRDPIIKEMTADNDGDWTPKLVYGWVGFDERTLGNKLLFAFLKVNKVIYNGFYFYFFPFLIIVLNYVSRNCETTNSFMLDGTTLRFNHTSDEGFYDNLCDPVEVFYLKGMFSANIFNLPPVPGND